ncbi:MAG: DUF4440 domain-containing protein [Euryarchaeota archaeon]|jgi:ketosteroid isomerase-like protein|nr:DUF4440 domain-containing protein [Euryarchaeota archaeon]MDP6835316.1 nuclear transport factor 2 family protein [Candidatus Poseidoniia archaeon]MDP7007268.1 nuclear transport factor 2 family protein [Candidatus Poseidoniia archaeon]|tara:strand:- start:199 stop:600 length:402 start_codon:yes stop_codon:yes gene_type:complete
MSKAEVNAANLEFYAALNKILSGQLAPMEAVWSHADDITYMGPAAGDYKVGWEAVRKDWEGQLGLRGTVEPVEVQITSGPLIATVSNIESIRMEIQGELKDISIRATNIFRKEDGHWKMIGHHVDPLPSFPSQ